MADTRRSRHTERAVAAITTLGARLSDGWLRHELLVASIVLSLFTLVMGLTSEHLGWRIGYCAAGTVGATASVLVLRRDGPRQWMASVGIAVSNVILLIVYGRMSGDL
ncbi:hypothetical protein [Nocardia flavorosea]|uniref:Uncharacterized protein n=1 Tax=Nocardia flavorosea TaxID=53429 RepID=A0A846YFG0_9NOCA|nr:hypothetical protein [Nocardia flavorosea]NKY56444.1 hypothetical protein [Nocardia flavorosea]